MDTGICGTSRSRKDTSVGRGNMMMYWNKIYTQQNARTPATAAANQRLNPDNRNEKYDTRWSVLKEKNCDPKYTLHPTPKTPATITRPSSFQPTLNHAQFTFLKPRAIARMVKSSLSKPIFSISSLMRVSSDGQTSPKGRQCE
jgi:hypothetical protein